MKKIKFSFFRHNRKILPNYIRDNAFMISCAARSGSTYLVHLIRSHPDLFFHGEILAGEKVNGLLGEYEKKLQENPALRDVLFQEREKNPALFLYKYGFDTQGYKGVGFKYKTDESLLDEYRQRTEAVVRDKDIKIIFLLRRNLLAQYVSHQVVLQQTGQTFAVHEEDVPQIDKLTIDPQKCIVYIKNVINRQKQVEKMFLMHRTFHIRYEDIVEGAPEKKTVLADLQKFLGVQNVDLSSPTKKIIREPLAKLVINYDEVCQELKRHKMGRFTPGFK